MPDLPLSLISIGQLRDCGCQILLRERSFVMHLGLLVIARGARVSTVYPMHVDHVRDGIVSISMQTCREREMRRVSFAHGLQDALHV